MRHGSTCRRTDDDNPRRVLLLRCLLQHGLEDLHDVEDPSYVQIQNLRTTPIWCSLEWATPCGAGVGNKDVDVVGVLLDLVHKLDELLSLACVTGYADGFASNSRQGVQPNNCLINTLFAASFAGCDDDKLRTLQEEGSSGMKAQPS